jgi:peptidoglycan hydrolase-like protein with peptidoglycan-binding domain
MIVLPRLAALTARPRFPRAPARRSCNAPAPDATPNDIIWYADYARGTLGRFDPGTGALDYASPGGPQSQPAGKIGDQIRAAVRAFQERNGLAPDGYPSLALLTQVSASRRPASRDGLKPPSKNAASRCGVSPALPAAPRLGSAVPSLMGS